MGYRGGKTVLNDFLREVRPPPAPSFEVRFERPATRLQEPAGLPVR